LNTWPQKQWIKLYGTYTSAANASYTVICSYLNTAGDSVYFVAGQCEQRAFITSFVNGSRSAGNFKLPPLLFPQASGTISCKVKLNATTAGKVFSNEDESGGNSIILNPNNSVIFNSGGTTLTANVSNIKEYHTYTYRVNADSKVSCFIDGVNVGNINKVIYTNRTNFPLGKDTNGSYLTSVTIKDFSIYNRALSDSEIKYLATSNFDLKTNGDLITSSVKSKQVIPSDAYYFPLGFDSKDYNKIISPSSESNLAYEDGAVWVGSSTSNLFSNQSTPSFNSAYNGSSYGFGSGTDMQQVIDPVRIFPDSIITKVSRIIGGTSQNDYVSWNISSPASSTRIISFWYYGTVGTSIQPYNNDNCANLYYLTSTGTWQGGSTSLGVPVIPNRWQKIILKMVNKGTAGTGLSWIILHSNSTTLTLSKNEFWKFTGIQVQEGIFNTPFVNGIRGISELEFNFNSSIGLDWSGNWSIIYWKKPVGTSNNSLTGYNIESLGCNSNSVGEGYLWWGKDNGSDAISNSSPSAIDPTKYFNNWRMVSLVKLGTTLTIKEWSPLEGIYTRTSTVSTSAANYYVTQYGYDLKLGGWNNGNPCNAFYRDLIVLKRALTNTEVENIYKEKLLLNNGINLQSSIKTGQVL